MQQFFPDTILYGGDYNPEQWSEAIWQEDMRMAKLAHVNMLTINVFSWALLEPRPEQYHFAQLDRMMDMLAEHGVYADLATGTASPPTWMSRLYPSMLLVTREGNRVSHGSRQHYCPNSPDYRRKSAELVQQLAEHYGSHPALKMWHINNEYGCHNAQCYCDNCAEAFRTWLQERYHSLETLNDAWGTSFWSQRYYHWEDVLPPRLTTTFHNPGQSLDYWRFMSDSLLGCYHIEEEILRSATPAIPLTTNFMVGFKPVDSVSWARHMDIVSFDMYPPNNASTWGTAFSHDLMRSLKDGQPHLVMEMSPSQVNWMPRNPHKRPGRMRLHVVQALAHGANGSMFFQWRQSQAGAEMMHGAVVTHEGSEHTRVFREAARVGSELQQLGEYIANSRISAQAAILIDWENWWALEYQPSPSDHLSYFQQVLAHYRGLHQLNIPTDVVAPDADFSNYRLIIAPLLYMLRSGVAENLQRFVEQGGVLLITYFSGIVDQNDHVLLGGYPAPLRKLLGIHVEEFDPWTDDMSNEVKISEGELRGTYPCSLWGELIHLEGAQAIGTFTSDYYAACPALTVNQFGQGRAYYVATQADPALLTRLTELLCGEAKLSPVLLSPEGVEVTRRVRPDGQVIYFILNHTGQAQRVPLPAGTFRSLLDNKQITEEAEVAAVDAMVLLAL
jgi:beta-galactosidase